MTQQFYLLFNRNTNMSMKNVHNFIYDHPKLEITINPLNEEKEDILWESSQKGTLLSINTQTIWICNKMYEYHDMH